MPCRRHCCRLDGEGTEGDWRTDDTTTGDWDQEYAEEGYGSWTPFDDLGATEELPTVATDDGVGAAAQAEARPEVVPAGSTHVSEASGMEAV